MIGRSQEHLQGDVSGPPPLGLLHAGVRARHRIHPVAETPEVLPRAEEDIHQVRPARALLHTAAMGAEGVQLGADPRLEGVDGLVTAAAVAGHHQPDETMTDAVVAEARVAAATGVGH